MCGRYTLYTTDELEERYRVEVTEAIRPNYNAAPSQMMPVVTNEGLEIMRWGLIPKWAKDEKIGYKLINARSESVFEKPMWRGIVKRNRCLVPANGFYEWQKRESGKQPKGAKGYINPRTGEGHSTQYYDDNTRLSWDTDGSGESNQHWTDQNIKNKKSPRRHQPPGHAK